MTSEKRSGSATEDPRLISASSRLVRVDCRIDQMGNDVRGSIFDIYELPGRPFSRAKAHVIRDAVARMPMQPKLNMAVIMTAMAIAPALEPTM